MDEKPSAFKEKWPNRNLLWIGSWRHPHSLFYLFCLFSIATRGGFFQFPAISKHQVYLMTRPNWDVFEIGTKSHLHSFIYFFFSILRHEKRDKVFNPHLKIRNNYSRRGIFELIDYKRFISSWFITSSWRRNVLISPFDIVDLHISAQHFQISLKIFPFCQLSQKNWKSQFKIRYVVTRENSRLMFLSSRPN